MKAKLELDPNFYYGHLEAGQIIDALGVLPQFLHDGLSHGLRAEEALITNYPYYSGPFDLGVPIHPDGSYTYPEDPTTQPLARVRLPGETVYFYPHAFVAVVKDTGEQWITRMD